MQKNRTKPNRLSVWGDSMMCGLKGPGRTRRKREASKKRRAILRAKEEKHQLNLYNLFDNQCLDYVES